MPGHAVSEPGGYVPLYAERRCLVCGRWRGQHKALRGAASYHLDSEMVCPVDTSYYGVEATFVGGLR